MGIVCHCRNGHRIKVKDRYAGTRALCPTCGTPFRVGHADGGKNGPTFPAANPQPPDLPLARFIPVDPALLPTLPRAVPYGTARAIAAATTTQPIEQAVEQPAEQPIEQDVDLAPAESSGQPSPALPAAIAERPDLSWRIAYPGGDPSEPVDADTMHEWIAGGQAEGTELVWRADWAEWVPVREVFPEFFPSG